jgi:homoserine dehydrogenase
MRTLDLALIGFGGVNRALAKAIGTRPERFADHGLELRVVAITDLALGTLQAVDGIDLGRVLALPRGATFAEFPGGSATADSESVIRNGTAEVIVEATFTNPLDGEPALSHLRWAIASGKHVVTTNKGPIALHGAELTELALGHGVELRFEGTVMSGTPVLRFAREQLVGLEVLGVQGILNGTSNYVLGRREAGLTLEEAVAEAQSLGYAEADPTADIGGSDARLKVAILANEVLGAKLTPDQVVTVGIDAVSEDDLASAAREGRHWKLIGSAHREDDGRIVAEVRPRALAADHPLASISGATNAVTFLTDMLGPVTVSGPGAGRDETAYALIADILSIHATTAGLVRV